MSPIRKLGKALVLLVILFAFMILLVGNGAADDIYEENDDLEHAVSLEPGVYADLSSSDPDCFIVNISTSGILRITLWYEALNGGLGLGLFDENTTELGVSETGSGEEQVEIDVVAGERYVFEVTNASGPANWSEMIYHLAIVNGNEDSWIFAVYMDGDNSLDENMEPDLVEIRAVGSGEGLHIPILKDGSGSKDTKIVYVTLGQDIEMPPYVVNQSWGKEVNMGDPAILGEWFAWTMATFDTGGKVALDLWDHGNGVWGVCWDDNSGRDILTLADIRKGIELAGIGEDGLGRGKGASGKDHIELLGSDSCLMQVLELPHGVRDLAKYFIASQEDEPKDGWDYEPFLRELRGNITWNGEELGRSIIRGYIQEYGVNGDETLSVLDVIKIGNLSDALDALGTEFIGNISIWADEIRMAREDTRDYNYYYVDLIHFLTNMRQRTDNKTILSLVGDAVHEAELAILHEEHGAMRYNSNGLSIYFPKSGFNNDYDSIAFSTDTGWGSFLKEWIDTPGGPGDHLERVLVYPTDNDTYPGDDTAQVKIKPYSDRTDETVVLFIELVSADGRSETIGICNRTITVTIHGSTSGYIDLYLPLEHTDVSGEYIVRVSLFDSEGNRDDIWHSDPISLHPFNLEPPVPDTPSIAIDQDIERPLRINEGESHEFQITVYAGIPTSYSWEVIRNENGDMIPTSTANTSSQEFVQTFTEPGNYILTVQAIDNWNQTGNASIEVRVNAVPVFNVDQSVRIANPGLIDIDMNVSDPDGQIMWYSWWVNGESRLEGEAKIAAPPRPFGLVASGNHTILLRVTDSDGAIREGSITIIINSPPGAISLEIIRTVDPSPPGMVAYAIKANGEDGDGGIVTYRWDLTGDGSVDMTTTTGSILINLSMGPNTVSVEVVDEFGLTNSSSADVVVLMDPEIGMMTIDRTEINADSLVQTGSNPLDLIISLRGYLITNESDLQLTVVLDEATILEKSISSDQLVDEEIALHIAHSPGGHLLRIIITEGEGGSTLAEREITVTFTSNAGDRDEDRGTLSAGLVVVLIVAGVTCLAIIGIRMVRSKEQ
jgi:hypothetical protein